MRYENAYQVIYNALCNLNIPIQKSDGNYRDPVSVILEIKDSLEGLNDEQKEIIRNYFL